MMNIEQKKDLIMEFTKLAKKSGAWYSLSGKTLLSAVKNNIFDEGDDPITVMMTIEGYNTLKKHYPSQVKDRSIQEDYSEIQPIFMQKRNRSKHSYILINIVVPTLIKKLSKFTNIKSRINFYCSQLYSRKPLNTKWKKVNYRLLFLFKNRINSKSHATVYNQLFHPKHEGFFEITKPSNQTYMHWIPQLTFRTHTIKLEKIDVEIPHEFNTILSNWYGEDYLETKK